MFAFNITYHLENPLNYSASTEIALPPDTNYQKMNYTNMAPKPTKISVDQDGNWLATYELKPRERNSYTIDSLINVTEEGRGKNCGGRSEY